MTFLILSDSETFENQIEQEVKKLKNSPKTVIFDISKEIDKKILKYVDDFQTSLVLIYLEKCSEIEAEKINQIYLLAGYILGKNIQIYTNLSELRDSIISKDRNLKFITENKKGLDLIKQIKSNYKKICSFFEQTMARKYLENKGIPCVADCFGMYISKKVNEQNTEICNMFIQAGIDINGKDENGTPMLNVAIRSDNTQMVEKLINLGCDINCISEDRGYSPVMDAVWRGNKEITSLLISKGAELNTINKEGQSNLVLAVGADKTEIVKLLAENGADPDIKDAMGMSAYGYASLFKKQEILDILKPYHKE